MVERRPDLSPTPVMGVPLFDDEDEVSLSRGIPTMGVPIVVRPGRATVTIGVALQIPEPWSTLLQDARDSFGDPQARAIPTHITLLPPTAVEPTTVDLIADHLRAVAAVRAPFRVVLEGTDTFRPISPVVFVKVVDGGGRCDELQRAVRTGPLARDLTFPYHPHVTVAHHLDDVALDRAATALARFRAEFTATAFQLYEHGADEVWRAEREFRFAGPDLAASDAGPGGGDRR